MYDDDEEDYDEFGLWLILSSTNYNFYHILVIKIKNHEKDCISTCACTCPRPSIQHKGIWADVEIFEVEA